MPSQPTSLTSRLKRWHITVICHVYPNNDLIEHVIFGEGCSCGAEAELGEMADGSPCYTITHNALDGRE